MKKNHFVRAAGLVALACIGLSNPAHAQRIAVVSPLPSLSETFNGYTYNKIGRQWKMHDPTSNQDYAIVTDQISVKFKTSASEDDIATVVADNHLELIRKARTGWADYTILENAGTIFTLANALQASPYVLHVEIGTLGEYSAIPNDPGFGMQWAFQSGSGVDINLLQAWDLATGDNTLKVAVIDTGVDFETYDLGMGTDGYQNIYLNSGEDPWSDPNDPSTGNGIDDDGNGLVDDWKGWHFGDGVNDSRSSHGNYHGNRVACIIAAKNNNGYGISGVAGGWGAEGVKVIPVGVENPSTGSPQASVVDDAILYAIDQGADIINISLGLGPNMGIQAALEEARDSGIVVFAAAGNSHNDNNVAFPASHPLTIAVGGSDQNDERWGSPGWGSNGGSKLDIVAPGKNVTSIEELNNIANFTGTSFATPMVSGVAALMLSVNPCLTPEQIQSILQATAVKPGGYNYDWNYNRPGHSKEMGFGRVDAYAAVLAAQTLYSPAVPDLAIRDHITDFGADAGYTFTWEFDESPDVWARNDDDGLINQYAEEIEFTADPSDPAYVYVKIWNNSCVVASGQTLSVYASAAGSNGDWPSGWTDWTEGGQVIGTVSVPDIEPGEYEIVTLPWVMMFSPNQCLLARVESADDPIVEYPGDLAQEVYQNNNIALRNLIVNNIFPGKVKPVFDDREVPYGTPVMVGNDQEGDVVYDFEFFDLTYGEETGLSTSAELTLHFTAEGWTVFEPHLRANRDVRILDDNTVEVLSDHLYLNDISIAGDTYFPVFVGYSFLTDEIDDQLQFEYHVVQKNDEVHKEMGDHWTGGVHFYIHREAREPFSANAGGDVYLTTGETAVLSASDIGEDADYNWYNSAGDLVHSGSRFSVTPESGQTYTLEVIAHADGYKDYDEVQVYVNPYYIDNISPNPAIRARFITVRYNAAGAEAGHLRINGVNVRFDSENYTIDTNSDQIRIDISTLRSGVYSVSLICDGSIADAEILSIE